MGFALTGARIFTGETFLDDHAVVVEGKHVARVVPEAEIGAAERRALGGGLLAPGFIDVQVNGGGGALLNDNPSVETVRTIATAHRRFGTVGMLPTVITDAPQVIARAVVSVARAMAEGVPGVLGIHIEGPFLDVARKGAHAARFIREMEEADADAIAGFAMYCPVMLTLAPNRVRPELVQRLTQAGVLVSLGHSDATYAEARAALDAGARSITHLFNAMSQMTGREPGLAGAALEDAEAYAGIIADGHHVHDAALKAAFAARPAARMMLITDAMPTAAGGPDQFELQGRTVTRHNGRLSLADGTLAGSDLTMEAAVRYCVGHLGMELATVLRMASLNPASFLRCESELGRIAPGHLASMVLLGDDLAVKQTWINGQ
ncbi:N-acetylglucosamine-6-phosphate deacetylase [Aestuariivirga litoralis]|uniref:N-acetylglucosamine-6-phosphate deacetylase n=1 Tax=Aestuariivirga litoralis TaxID=2650924 RepID=A0A2W2B6E8_9HYPH|nr:N-acetylglucosamine-6-phosphate deacetylase [Aestuariivirga litoralis]PZF75698.1 N-acetylglucosamine-6-phosphate deacetylase [Aestuariivirga litoralis]